MKQAKISFQYKQKTYTVKRRGESPTQKMIRKRNHLAKFEMYSPWRESFLDRHKYVKVKTRKSKETQNKRQTNEMYLEECRMNEKRLEPYNAER